MSTSTKYHTNELNECSIIIIRFLYNSKFIRTWNSPIKRLRKSSKCIIAHTIVDLTFYITFDNNVYRLEERIIFRLTTHVHVHSINISTRKLPLPLKWIYVIRWENIRQISKRRVCATGNYSGSGWHSQNAITIKIQWIQSSLERSIRNIFEPNKCSSSNVNSIKLNPPPYVHVQKERNFLSFWFSFGTVILIISKVIWCFSAINYEQFFIKIYSSQTASKQQSNQ